MATNRRNVGLIFGNNVYRLGNVNDIPFGKGIYAAYAGRFNGQSVDLNKLLYIGMADDTTIKQRIIDHTNKHHADWKRNHCRYDEDIYYRVARLDSGIRDVEAAMIFTHKPPCNSDGKDTYNGDRPAPNVLTDITITLDVDGSLVDMQDLCKRISKDGTQ